MQSTDKERKCDACAGMPFSHELPKYALEALRPLLSIWERAGASERRLRDEQLPLELLSAVSSTPHALQATGIYCRLRIPPDLAADSACHWLAIADQEARLLEHQLCCIQVEAAADRMCAALPSAEAPLSTPAALYHSSGGAPGLAQHAMGLPGADSASQAALPEEVAEMAACWAQLLVNGPSSGNVAKYGLAGIAACLLVVSCPR